MKKTIALILVSLMLTFLVACGADNGGETKPADTEASKTDVDTSADTDEETQGGVPIDQFSEKYVCIYMDAYGSPLTDLDILKDYTLELKGDGTGKLELDGIENEFTWKVDGGKIVMTSYTDTVATVDGDVITIDDWMEQGVAYKFAKEGSEAASAGIPEPLSEEEQAIIGTWTSYKVTDLLDEDLSDEIDPGSLTMDIKEDRTVDIEAFGEDLGTETWEYLLGSFALTESDYSIDWELDEDDNLVVDVLLDDDSYARFYCVKDQ